MLKLKWDGIVFDAFVKCDEQPLAYSRSRMCQSCVNKHGVADEFLEKRRGSVCGVDDCMNEADYRVYFDGTEEYVG